jgi:ABC-type antimicrobial peptide transport system permease subunit
MGRGLRLLAIGGGIGLSAGLWGTSYIESQLFGVSATDPVTFAVSGAVLGTAGLVACLIPARRALRVDPMAALRR